MLNKKIAKRIDNKMNNMCQVAEDETKYQEMSKENFVTDDGKVYILGPFDRSISGVVIPSLVQVIEQKMHEKNPILEIYINSYGGYASELFALLTIIQIAKKARIAVVTYNLGVAYSCGSILAVVGDHRLMSQYADNVAHLGMTGQMSNTFKQLERQTEFNKKHFNKIIDIYEKHTKMTRKKIVELLSDDHLHLDPKQCLKLGLCDEVI